MEITSITSTINSDHSETCFARVLDKERPNLVGMILETDNLDEDSILEMARWIGGISYERHINARATR